MVLGAALSLAARVHVRAGTHTQALESLRDSIVASDDIGDRPTLFTVLDRGIEVLASVGDAEGAAVLAGIVTVGPFCEFTSLQGGPEEEARNDIIDELRAELGVNRFTAVDCRRRGDGIRGVDRLFPRRGERPDRPTRDSIT